MEIDIKFKHRINYKQRYKSCVKINGVVVLRGAAEHPEECDSFHSRNNKNLYM